jgi:apolipoprotein N-acyltransferase
MTNLFVEAYRTGDIRPGRGTSLYLTIGDAPAWLCVLLTAGIAMLGWFKRKKLRPDHDKKNSF